MTQEREDLSGTKGLPNRSILIGIDYKRSGITELSNPNHITSLFLHNNQIVSLEGFEAVANLQEIQINVNQGQSPYPLAKVISSEANSSGISTEATIVTEVAGPYRLSVW